MLVATLYGIKNCDSVKKARRWLEQHAADYRFHDFREHGLDKSAVSAWIDQLGWETVVNKRSTTWKQLSDAQRQQMDAKSAIACILENPTLVKRPLLDLNGAYHVGFNADHYSTLFTP